MDWFQRMEQEGPPEAPSSFAERFNAAPPPPGPAGSDWFTRMEREGPPVLTAEPPPAAPPHTESIWSPAPVLDWRTAGRPDPRVLAGMDQMIANRGERHDPQWIRPYEDKYLSWFKSPPSEAAKRRAQGVQNFFADYYTNPMEALSAGATRSVAA